MAWEKRNRNGRYYYYHAQRDGKSVRKTYVGHGARARELARQVEQRKASREAERWAIKELEARLWPIDQRMRIIHETCRQAYHAVHCVAGYRLTKSYNWKPGRAPMNNEPGNAVKFSESQATNPAWPATIQETLQQLKSGRRDLLPHLRWQLRQVPALWRHCGDLGRLTQSACCLLYTSDAADELT